MEKVIFNTSGNGYWSDEAKAVSIVDMRINYCSDEMDFGELRVYFDTKTWDVEQDGLIYTDDQFEEELRAFLDSHGLPGKDVSYSEQGMQGDDYVSLDVGADFIHAWGQKFGMEAMPA